MRKYLLIITCLISCMDSLGQSLNITLQRCLGGSRYEALGGVVRAKATADSGSIVIATTNSEDGDVSGLHTDGSTNPPRDMWVVKLNKYGGIQWQKCYGGSKEDFGYSIDTAGGNSYFIAGYVYSNDGNISGHHNSLSTDGWVAKLGSTGNIIWQKCVGGSGLDDLRSVKSTPDGGCIVVGVTHSIDGDITGHHDPTGTILDAWALKLDASGNITWSRCYGSSQLDDFWDVLVAADGNYIAVGNTLGRDGDVSGNHPGISLDVQDGWVVKLDKNNGNILWQRCYGGENNDGFGSGQSTPDGGYIFVGSESSVFGEQVSNANISGPNSDAWIVKTDANGNFSWTHSFGGAFNEGFNSAALAKDGFVFGGSCSKNNGDVQGPGYDLSNIWVVKTSFTGTLLWQRVMGGDKDDYNGSAIVGYDGNVAVFGKTNSSNGDIRHFHQSALPPSDLSDVWFARFTAFNTISLNGFADLNSNNIKEVNEPYFPYYKVELVKNNTLLDTYASANDTLRMYTDTGSYVATALTTNNYYSPSPSGIAANFTTWYNNKRSDIAFKPIGTFNDLTIKMISLTGNSRAGRSNTYRLYYENAGTTPLTPVIRLVKDSRTTYITSTTGAVVVNDTITFSLSQLQPVSGGFIYVTLSNATSLVLHDTLVFNANILPVVNDAAPADNQYQLKVIITGSYDPNDKTESHGGVVTRAQVTSGEYLDYTIRFQNTGNDTAFIVTVKDTLSNKYELSSLKFITASHPVQFALSGSVCTWYFDTINLPDSNRNEPGSHGFIHFRIKVKTNIAEGDSISNSASIYFDYNSPVKTDKNTTTVKVGTITAVQSPGQVKFIKLFPNPTKDGRVMVQSTQPLKGNVYIEVFNEAGSTVAKYFMGKNPDGFKKEINLGNKPGGNYLVVIRDEKARYTYKMLWRR